MKATTCCALAALLVAGSSSPGQRAPEQPVARTGFAWNHEQGRAIYNFRCSYCHGYSGDARTLASTFLSPPPRDFTALAPGDRADADLVAAVRDGRPGSAMPGFGRVLSAAEIAAVSGFVREEFIHRKASNARYHSAANGWPNHDRYRAAFPFATGEIALDTDAEDLDAVRAAGKRLFLGACVSCHDRGKATRDGAVWELSAASPPDSNLERRGVAPRIARMSALERRGEAVFQRNCAFCHGADGSGRNRIGTFLEPHPRDLTDPGFRSGISASRLKHAIREGISGTAMPAWKSVLRESDIEAVAAYVARAFAPESALDSKQRSSVGAVRETNPRPGRS